MKTRWTIGIAPMFVGTLAASFPAAARFQADPPVVPTSGTGSVEPAAPAEGEVEATDVEETVTAEATEAVDAEPTDVEETVTAEATGPAEPSEPAASSPPPVRRSAVVRRRDASLVGGWVRSGAGDTGIEVEEMVLASNGEWLRRRSVVSPATGLVGEPATESGIWFTEEGALVLLERGSLVNEAWRASYLLNDPADRLTAAEGEAGAPVVFHRFR